MPNLMYRNKPLFHFESTGYATPCWLWDRTIVYGYGQTRLVGADGLKNVAKYAHVWLWEMQNGPVPDGLELDHLCKIRRCCRPDHCEPVTAAVNAQRRSSTRLTQRNVEFIRSSDAPHVRLAELFNVSPNTVADVRRRKTWR